MNIKDGANEREMIQRASYGIERSVMLAKVEFMKAAKCSWGPDLLMTTFHTLKRRGRSINLQLNRP